VRWLDLGAAKVILGTAARPEILSRLPRDRVIAALDARHGEVVVEGWREGTGRGVLERIAELKAHVGGFLVTFVEREGRMGGTDLELARAVVDAAGKDCRVTIAGGVTTADEIRALDEIGADAQVGMALYTGRLDLADAIMAPLVTDRPDGLWPTIVVDERGVCLGLVYSSRDSIREAVRRRMGVYQSRSRGLWVKGETSGAVQELLRIDLDCDRDSPRFVVRQRDPGFCHLDTRTCWGEDAGLGRLARTLAERRENAPPGSYTAKLLADPTLLAAKLREEADELGGAEGREQVIWEAADLLYFTLARLTAAGVDLAEVEAHLDRRALKVTRRG
jgi:phosphoribosyl-ATP pyrophosphohydrolase